MRRQQFIDISLFIGMISAACVSDNDTLDLEDFAHNDENLDDEDLDEDDDDRNVSFGDGVDQLTNQRNPALSYSLPEFVTHNTIYTGSFTYGWETCNFTFFFGNYGVGYAWIKMSGGPGCRGVESHVVSAAGPYFYEDNAWIEQPNIWAEASTNFGSIINASYCVELHSWGSLNFSYNALTNTLELPVGEDPVHPCIPF